LGRAGRPVRPADLVHLPQEPAGGRRRQDVWLNLVGQLGKIRDPAALPGWPPPPGANAAASRAARRPCNARHALAAGAIPDDHAPTAAIAWTSYAATRQSPRLSTPTPRTGKVIMALLCILVRPAIQDSALAITTRMRRNPRSASLAR
jgi:hypothetical protein